MQLDLFAPRATPPAPPVVAAPPFGPASLLPARPIPWQRLLAQAACPEVTVMAVANWTGVVVETLSDPALGRRFLHRDGLITEAAPDPGYCGRTVFLTPAQAAELHRRAPLVCLNAGGTHSVRLRFAGPDDAPQDVPGRLARLEGFDG